MVGSASRLVDWEAAARIGSRVAGTGPAPGRGGAAAVHREFETILAEADAAVASFTGLRTGEPPTRPWVMSRAEWIRRNLRAFEAVLEPVAERLLGRRLEGALAPVRRSVLAAQIGGILGYLGRKVLGQYDLFMPPDDRDLLYFVGPNVTEVERRFRFPPRDFRLWLALHEVTHRAQFDGVPWLRGYLFGLMEEYLSTIQLDPRRLLEDLRRAVSEARRSDRWRELGILFLLMTPEQRTTFRKMQALMSLLEGHGNFVMDRVGLDVIRDAARMRSTLRERRQGTPASRVLQRAIGVDVKVRQYDVGEAFVSRAVELAGPDGFARLWERPEHLPTLEEIARPGDWVERVAAA
ncbi:MAG TPA: zinc-dependent metalloprotease [Actinomycetota bacterium]|nr:zinc-dependent metalloprotease [Actinomycetota bacterium]